MKKTTHIGPIRISEADKLVIQAAVAISGSVLAAKIRQLAMDWAAQIVNNKRHGNHAKIHAGEN